MTDNARSNMDLKSLFTKLGNKLEEIRVRALKSLLSKLEHNLVCEADLVQERHLLIRLLEWFNFPTCPLQKEVLQLIHTLTKHVSAAGLVLEIGGVEFLTQLRPNSDPSLHSLIDATLDQLFHLPSSPPAPQHSAECIYKSASHETDPHAHTHSSIANQSAASGWTTQTSTSMWSSTINLVTVTASDYMGMAHPSPQTIPSPPDSQAGYFGGLSHGSTPRTQYSPPRASAACFKFSTFPWIALVPTDRHVLSSTDMSLQNTDLTHVVSACEFLSDVVFQDFPAEVFVQRPSIVKSLLSLLEVRPVGGVNVALPSVHALRDLSVSLKARIRFYQDPALYTPKQVFPNSRRSSSTTTGSLRSSDTRPPLVGRSDGLRARGDGQDGDQTPSYHNSPSVGGVSEELDYEDMAALQFVQWSLPQYATSLLHTVAPMLASPTLSVVTTALQILQQVSALLQEAVDPELLWEDQSVAALELTEQLQESFELLADAVQYHHHSGLSDVTPAAELATHQVALTGIATFTSDLIKFCVPGEKVERVVPELCQGMLTVLAVDCTLNVSHPEVRETMLPYLERVSPTGHRDFLRSQEICQAQKATTDFLSKWPDQVAVNIEELVALSRSGLDSLMHHQHLPYVDACVQLCSHVCRKTQMASLHVHQSRLTVLNLLAHPLKHVKGRAYASCRDIIMDALGVGHAVDPSSHASQAVKFLLHRHVLYEITCFGLSDSSKNVEEMAGQILLHLLQGQLLMSSAMWQQLLEALTPVLPIIQGFAALEKGLGGCVLGLLETKAHIQTGTLPMHERLRGTLRLMYRQETRMRTEGLGRLAWFLTQEEGAARKLPQFSDLQVGDLTNLLLVHTPTSLQEGDDERSVFQEDGLQKVFEIFASVTVEDDVKKAAVDQLGIMLQDPALHKAFTVLNGPAFILKHLHEGIQRSELGTQNPSQTMLPSLVKILRHLVQRNFTFRHQMAQDTSIYYAVIRAALMYSGDEDARQEAAQLLALLLWDESASIATWDADADTEAQKEVPFSLPTFVTNRYRLPFRCATHHSQSPYLRPAAPTGHDPLTEGLLAQGVRLDWHVNWCGGMEALVKWCASTGQQPEDDGYSGPLELTVVDRAVLCAAYLPVAIKELLFDVNNATSHRAVSRGVNRILAHLICSGVSQVGPILASNHWNQTVDRFFRVRPSSSVDEALLTDVLEMLVELLSARGPPDTALVTWLSSVLHADQGALVTLLARSDQSGEDLPVYTKTTRRVLNRQLLKFVHIFIAKLPYCLTRNISEDHRIQGIVTQACLSRLSSANATHFYNLASLERTLLALVHITARPGWSVSAVGEDSLAVCQQMLNMLLEVVAAFHVGRGGLCMSYMGRGVTRAATLCLCHLAYEMTSQLRSQDWPRNWLFSRQGSPDLAGESGLGWLTTLWTYRDTEVRAAGLGIAVALSSTESGRLTMATQCQHIHGGTWGAAFGVLLDHSECSLVRQQAALLLVNLTSTPLPFSPDDIEAVWRGPVISSDQTQESLVGLPALLSLLQHTHFYQEVLVMLANYYTQPAIHPVSVSADSHSTMLTSCSQSTLTTSDSSCVQSSRGQDADWKAVTASPSSGESKESTPRQEPVSSSQHQANPSTASPPEPSSNQSTSAGNTEGKSVDYLSVTGPGLIAVVGRLLRNIINLSPNDAIPCLSSEGVLKTIASVIDVRLLETYAREVASSSSRSGHLTLVALSDQLHTHISAISILQACVVQDQGVLEQFLQETNTLKHIILLLTISLDADGDIGSLCELLWEAVFTLLRVLLQHGGQGALQHLTPVLTRHWAPTAARCVHILQTTSSIDTSLWFSVLHFLAVLLAEEGRTEVGGAWSEGTMTVTYRLETATKTGDPHMLAGPSGSVLCTALVHVYDTVTLQLGDKALTAKCAITSTLKCLLTVSLAAKATALEGGLVETIMDQLRQLTVTLNMDALEAPKTGKNKKKDQPATSELILTIELFRNFMYNSYDVKLAAYECGLAQCMHKLWAWAQVEPALLTSILALLTTFTARCPAACSSLVFTSALGVVERGVGQMQYSQHSLVHCLIKLTRKESTASGHAPTLKATFAILATTSLSQECRGVLWKSNFLHEFSSLSAKRPNKKATHTHTIETCWLRLMLNLSFSTDGQGMILKVKDSVSLLVEFAEGSSVTQVRCALLTVRNLCFHAANKPKLLANARLTPLLVDSVESGSEDVRAIAASALMALAYNSQKAKVALKTTATVRRLQETYNTTVHLSQMTPGGERSVENLKNLLALLRQ